MREKEHPQALTDDANGDTTGPSVNVTAPK
jgi:hypothetical protein